MLDIGLNETGDHGILTTSSSVKSGSNKASEVACMLPGDCPLDQPNGTSAKPFQSLTLETRNDPIIVM
jgi:hypothetical protein